MLFNHPFTSIFQAFSTKNQKLEGKGAEIRFIQFLIYSGPSKNLENEYIRK